jgi:membrane-associated phospholipid phosphatase
MAAPRVLGRVRRRSLRARLLVLRAIEGRFRGIAIARRAWLWGLLLLAVAALVGLGAFRRIDATAFDAAQSVRVGALDLLSSIVNLFGQSEVTAGIALGLAVARLRTSRRAAVVPLFIAAVVVVESLLKIVVPEAPPPHERARTIEVLPTLRSPFAYSFPSGHVARFTFLARIAHGVPTWLVVVGILLMAATRIYLGEHWLSDTIGGALVGLLVADVARAIERR